jgi:hypothetical protein
MNMTVQFSRQTAGEPLDSCPNQPFCAESFSLIAIQPSAAGASSSPSMAPGRPLTPDLTATAASLLETHRLLARQRLVLDHLLTHFEGLMPGTESSGEVALRIARQLTTIRGLEETIRATFSGGSD